MSRFDIDQNWTQSRRTTFTAARWAGYAERGTVKLKYPNQRVSNYFSVRRRQIIVPSHSTRSANWNDLIQLYATLDISRAIQSESVMLDAVATGKERYQFMLWRCTKPCLVVPHKMACLPGFGEASLDALKQGYPVSVRETGGGAVIQSTGTLNISIAFTMPEKMSDRMRGAYEFLCEPVMRVLHRRGANPTYGAIEGAMCDGAYNIVVDRRKLAGTAQRWRRAKTSEGGYAILGHLVLSVDADHLAACHIVNAFHASLGVATYVKAESHINWVEIASSASLDEALENAYRRHNFRLRNCG